MILFYIYLIVSVVTLLQFLFVTIDASMRFKKLHPNISYEKTSLINAIGVWFRLFLFCFVPIINIIMSLSLLFTYEDTVKSTICKVCEKYKDQIEKEN
jgi:hypothetical protein